MPLTPQAPHPSCPPPAPEREWVPPASSRRTQLEHAGRRLRGCTARMADGLRRLQAAQ